MHNFQEFLKFDLNYETVMSFLIIGRKFVHVKAPMFPKALSTALKWMEMNQKVVPPELAAEYKELFNSLTIKNGLLVDQDFVQLFKLCRSIKGDTLWIKKLEKPYTLFEDLAALNGSTKIVFEMLQNKHLYDLSYFDFIDYIIQNPFV